jgi:hypothetical protein
LTAHTKQDAVLSKYPIKILNDAGFQLCETNVRCGLPAPSLEMLGALWAV